MATNLTTLPVEYLSALDEVLAGATYASRYDVGGAEFVSGHQVSVPDIDFGGNADPVDYSRFASEADVTLNRTVYTLDHDVEKSFYVDAVNVIDDPAAAITNIVSQYQRTVFAQKVDADFFAAVAKAAKTTASEAITAANVKGVIAAHDGSVYTYEIVGRPAPGYSIDDESFGLAYDRRSSDEARAFEAIGQLFGVRIVHLKAGK